MSRYPDEIRAQALAMLQTEGYDATIRALGITKDTLYRWKREAGLVLPNRRIHRGCVDESSPDNGDPKPPTRNISVEDDNESSNDNDSIDSPSPASEPDDGMLTDMMLLSAANEQLRMRNAQLRKALAALLEH